MVNPLKEFKFDDKEILLKKVITPKHLAKYSKSLTRVEKDTTMMITGYPGEGKSVLAREIAKLFDRRYNDDRNCIYSRNEFMSKIEAFPPSAFILDEAINLLYKRDWNKGTQKELIRALNVCRSKRHLLIFIQPFFSDMDPDIRKSRLRLWIFVIKRGLAVVFRPIQTLSGEEDPWNLKENNILVKKFVKKYGKVIGTIEGCYRTENFLSFLRWENISKEEYNLYEEVKDRKKYAEDDKEAYYTKEELRKEVLKEIFKVYAVLEAEGKIKQGARGLMAAQLKISDSTAAGYLKRSRLELGLIKKQEVEMEDLKINEEDVDLYGLV
ncbi:MAG: hypothetical protein NC935_02265 [Candidatus Omnitrophica bacterium]|nr:hypothetical protein [Candidatus Omnitrophota bacterium]